MHNRFRNFVGSKRRSSNQVPTTTTAQDSLTPPALSSGSPRPPSQSPPTNGANSSSTSLPMNPSNPALGRPPSYSNTNASAGNVSAPAQHVRPSSPLPPINTSIPNHGYLQQPQPGPPMYGHPPPPPGPPGYHMQGGYQYNSQPPAGPNSYYNRAVAEVEGSARSKAQLIVGIDFVGSLSSHVLGNRKEG